MEQNPPPPQFPSPEELKAKITEFMKQNFGDRVSVATFAEPEPAAAEEEEKPEKIDHQEFEFNLLPRDIKAHLDRFVIKQDEAKKVLAIAVCDHYNDANYLRAPGIFFLKPAPLICVVVMLANGNREDLLRFILLDHEEGPRDCRLRSLQPRQLP